LIHFAGGGSIPLEALRLGCDAFATDLNPVACLILKVLLEDFPRHGPQLADHLRKVGAEIKVAAEKEMAEFYPPDPDGAKPIAYLWARTIRCEQPNCGAEIPLVRSFWLRKKGIAKCALRYRVLRANSKPPQIEFEIYGPQSDRDVPAGTVTRAKATCPCCNIVLSPDRVRAQLAAQRGGADVIFDDMGTRIGGATLLTVVTLKPNEIGRHYRLPVDRDYKAAWRAMTRLISVACNPPTDSLSAVPDEPLPKERAQGNSGFRVLLYGMDNFGSLFSARQKLLLATFATKIAASNKVQTFLPLKDAMGLSVSRSADYSSTVCTWHVPKQLVRNTFGRQALPITWDFCETNLLGDGPGSFDGAVDWIAKIAERATSNPAECQVQVADACEFLLPDDTASVWFTDPPYYDAIAYADLSDFFYVWLKRTLPGHPLLRDPFDPDNPLSPKGREVIQDPARAANGRTKDRQFFELTMCKAFTEGRRVLKDSGIGCVVFAHKTTEGWEALLSGIVKGGWAITGSWPIATEMGNRLIARESAALSASVHLICRPRPENAPVGDWGEVLRELPKRVKDWMDRLQLEHVRGADLVFACIGPALEIYSRYSKVVDAEDREIPLGGDPEATEPHRRGYLAYVWEAVGRAALEQVLGTAEAGGRNGAAGALEEDARLTALFLWTLQSTNGQEAEAARREAGEEQPEEDSDEEEENSPKKKKKGLTLVFDVARRFAQPLGIHLDNWENRIIQTEKGIVRLLPVAERGSQLFGQDGADLVAERLEREPAATFQLTLFPEKTDPAPTIKGRKGRGKKAKGQSQSELKARQEATTLDRVHAAMLLQASGRTNALRALLQAEQDRSPDFLRLANALSALYPRECEEKRLLDAMLLAVPK
jgi:putative DNA methylase